MSISLEEAMARLSPERQAKIHARALELLAEEEELSLRDLRVLQRLTQQRVAETLGVEQDSVSRMEHRSDMLVSTMTRYVEAVGGKLTILAELPDRRPYHIVLSDPDSDQAENAR